MREIKFRAWDSKNKKMIGFDLSTIYGYEGEVCGVILPDEQTVLNFNSGYGMKGFNQDLNIMQFTGLKDKNGVDIYESDIVETCKEDYSEKCIVRFGKFESSHEAGVSRHHYHQGFYLEKDGSQYFGACDEDPNMFALTVIGNIHENPELLEAEQ